MNRHYNWKIRCPVSKKEFSVEDETAILNECECCDDEFDKQQIKNAIPYKIINEPSLSNADIEHNNVEYALLLKDLRTRKVLTISGRNFLNGECIIGREGDIEPDFFDTPDKFVGRRHCRIRYVDFEYRLDAFPTENRTRLNGVDLCLGIPMKLRECDFIDIANRQFEVAFCVDLSEVAYAN
jgi:hypothetical protein